MEPGREDEKEETDVIWDENGTARYRVLKDMRIVDFDGHNLGWIDDQGNVFDYKGHQKGVFENGVLRDPEGAVVGLGKDPAGPKPMLESKGLIPKATKPEPEPTRLKAKKILKKPQASLLWSQKTLEEL